MNTNKIVNYKIVKASYWKGWTPQTPEQQLLDLEVKVNALLKEGYALFGNISSGEHNKSTIFIK